MAEDARYASAPAHGRDESLWLATTPETDYASLEGGVHVDTAVVGGGIAGLTAATCLAERGQTVAVLEADRIVEGVTGHTTAKITSQHGLRYHWLVSHHGVDLARQYAAANEAAIEEIAARSRSIDCAFERLPAYVYANSSSDVSRLRAEARAARRLALPVSFTRQVPLPFETAGAVRFDGQAQFHPRKYLLGLAADLVADGNYVFENTRATKLDVGRPSRVTTPRGQVAAANVVVATHFPFADRGLYFSRMHPKRAYLMAVRISGPLPDGMFYSSASPPDTFRPYVDGDTAMLIVGGQGHSPGVRSGPGTTERYRRVRSFAARHFDVESVEYRWSTHDYAPVDRVPFVGQLGPRTRNVYVATGFDGWGMTGGTAAGMILADLVVDGTSPWGDVFDPQRLRLAASAKRFLTKNATVCVRFLRDRLTTASGDGRALGTDEARIDRGGDGPVARYRDEQGELHEVSAVCTHLDCLVTWNDAERTWDCPCHGSRFTYDGEVIAGPALDALPEVDVDRPQ